MLLLMSLFVEVVVCCVVGSLLVLNIFWNELQVVLATDQYGRRHQLELTFDVIYEDGPIGDTSETSDPRSASVCRSWSGFRASVLAL